VWCLGVTDWIGHGDWGRDVEDAVAAGDGRRHAAVVEQFGPEQAQPVRGAVHRRQVRVLGVACAPRHARYPHVGTHARTHTPVHRPGARRQEQGFRTRITDGAMDHVSAAGEEALDEPRGHEAARAGHAHRRPRPDPRCAFHWYRSRPTDSSCFPSPIRVSRGLLLVSRFEILLLTSCRFG
jgi:hypothetical protein